MAHLSRGHYSGKHSADKKINEALAKAIKERAKNGEISCAAAHAIAKEFGVSPDEVGFTMDMLEIPLVKCQLGLFGYSPQKKVVKAATEVPDNLREEIEKALENGRLSCKRAWNIAVRLGLKRMDISAACEKLGIKIGPCQLGAF
ncbi:MAG: hypothetical protein DRG39_03640 [Deltaproteobacteria bacterium]|nr:MAG: hypothetical protein DRG39_03640 [Deltaproteobacteria bacterium]